MLGYSVSDAQRTIAPVDPVYFQKSYILPKEQFYLLSVKRATAHYYQFYNAVAKEKRAKEIIMVEMYPDSLITDTNLLISQVNIEQYKKGFLTEEIRLKYVKETGSALPIIRYDTVEWKQYRYERRNRTVSVWNKLYGQTDNYADSLRTFYFNCRKRLVRTITRNDEQKQTDTRFLYKNSGNLVKVSSVYVDKQTQMPITEKQWELTYKNQAQGTTIPAKLLDSAHKIAALDFIKQLSGPPDKAKKITITSFEKLPLEQEFHVTGLDSMIINYKGDYSFVVRINKDDTALQVKKIAGNQAVHRVYLELSAGDDRKRSFKYTSRRIAEGQLFYENNFRGKTNSGSCSLDIEKTVISDTEDGTLEFYRIRR